MRRWSVPASGDEGAASRGRIIGPERPSQNVMPYVNFFQIRS